MKQQCMWNSDKAKSGPECICNRLCLNRKAVNFQYRNLCKVQALLHKVH